VLREQYMRDIVRAFAATNRCLDYFQIIFRPEIADNPAASWNDPIYWREIPLYDALSAAAAVGNIKAFDHFFHNNPKVLTEAGALLDPLHSAAGTGKSVMIEYLLVKIQHEIMDIKCHCRTPLEGPLAREAECRCERYFYRFKDSIKAVMRNNNVRAVVKLIEGLPKVFPYLVKRDRPNFLYLAMECSSLVLIKKFLEQRSALSIRAQIRIHVLAGYYELLRNDDMAIVFY
jgi:hypothetical protein